MPDPDDCVPRRIDAEDEITQPIPHETLSEITARWKIDIANLSASRPTVNLRRIKKDE